MEFKRVTTKELCSAALIELCETHDINKISVRDVVEHANISRQSFYYHFMDMSDLVCYTAAMPGLQDDMLVYDRKHMVDSLRFQREHRGFFSQIGAHEGQNALRRTYVAWVKNLLGRFADPSELSSGELARRRLCIALYAHGCIEITLEWAASGMQEEPEDVVEAMVAMTPDFLRNILWTEPFKAENYPQ